MKSTHIGRLSIVVLTGLILGLLAPSAAQAAFPGPNGKIAFHSDRDGDLEIFVMDPTGVNQVQLTANTALDSSPAFSADGDLIVFDSNRDGDREIFVMNANGTSQTQLTSNASGDFRPAFSPDGSKIVFMSLRTGNPEVWVMDSDGTDPTQLTFEVRADDSVPVFSPDGSKIAFNSSRDGDRDIYVMNPDGSGQTPLTANSTNDFAADYSPDGSKIVFYSDRDGDPEIFVMNPDGSSQTQITANTTDDLRPVYSPDGTQISFESDRDGDHDIFVMNANGTSQMKRTTNTSEDGFPDWQPTVVRAGEFSCRASALRLGGLEPVVANPPDVPCVDDAAALANVPLNLGLIGVNATAVDATTNQTPDDLSSAPPAVGDKAEARSGVADIDITVGLVTISATVIQSQAKAQCTSSAMGLKPVLSSSSSVSAVTVNGVPLLGGGVITTPFNLVIPGVLSLRLNQKINAPGSVTQRALVVTVGGLALVVAESQADFTGNPCIQ